MLNNYILIQSIGNKEERTNKIPIDTFSGTVGPMNNVYTTNTLADDYFPIPGSKRVFLAKIPHKFN